MQSIGELEVILSEEFMQKTHGSQDKIKIVSALYYLSRFTECLDFIRQQRSFSSDLILSIEMELIFTLFEGISLLQLGDSQDGYTCLQKLKGLIEQDTKNAQTTTTHLKVALIAVREYFFQEELDDQFYPFLLLLLDARVNYEHMHANKSSFNQQLVQYATALDELTWNMDFCSPGEFTNYSQIIQAKEISNEFKIEIRAMLSWITMSLNRYNESLNYLKEIKEINPKFPKLNYRFVKAYISLGDFDSASKFMDDAMQLNPDNCVVLIHQQILLFSINKNPQNFILQNIEKIIEQKPTFTLPFILKSQYHFSRSEYEEAKETLQKANDIRVSCQVQFFLVHACQYLQQLSEGLKLADQCAVKFPKVSLNWFQLGMILVVVERFENAIEIFERFLQIQREKGIKKNEKSIYFEALQGVSFCWQQLGNFEKCFFLEIQLLNENDQYEEVLSTSISTLSAILNDTEISNIKDKTNWVNKVNQMTVVRKFEKLIPFVKDVPAIADLLRYKLAELTTIQSLIAFKHIQKYLQFQSLLQHWDLYIN